MLKEWEVDKWKYYLEQFRLVDALKDKNEVRQTKIDKGLAPPPSFRASYWMEAYIIV